MSVFLGEEEKRFAVKLDIPLTTGPRRLLPTPPRLSTKNLAEEEEEEEEDHFLTISIRPRRRRRDFENTKTH